MDQEQAVTASAIRSDRLAGKLATLAALCFVGTLLADLAFAYSGEAACRAAAFGLIDGGLGLALFAATAFMLDRLLSTAALSPEKTFQAWCWLGIVVVEAANLVIRGVTGLGASASAGLVLSIAAIALLSLGLARGWHAQRATAAAPIASAG